MTNQNDQSNLKNYLAVIDATVNKAKSYLNSSFQLEVKEKSAVEISLDEISLRSFSSVIGIGGKLDVYVAFSFQKELLDKLYSTMTLGINVSKEEVESLRSSVANEVVNIVIGHATSDLQLYEEGVVSISPPCVINLMKKIPRLKDAVFCKKTLVTPAGELDIFTLAPKELFTINLDYK